MNKELAPALEACLDLVNDISKIDAKSIGGIGSAGVGSGGMVTKIEAALRYLWSYH